MFLCVDLECCDGGFVIFMASLILDWFVLYHEMTYDTKFFMISLEFRASLAIFEPKRSIVRINYT